MNSGRIVKESYLFTPFYLALSEPVVGSPGKKVLSLGSLVSVFVLMLFSNVKFFLNLTRVYLLHSLTVTLTELSRGALLPAEFQAWGKLGNAT